MTTQNEKGNAAESTEKKELTDAEIASVAGGISAGVGGGTHSAGTNTITSGSSNTGASAVGPSTGPGKLA